MLRKQLKSRLRWEPLIVSKRLGIDSTTRHLLFKMNSTTSITKEKKPITDWLISMPELLLQKKVKLIKSMLESLRLKEEKLN